MTITTRFAVLTGSIFLAGALAQAAPVYVYTIDTFDDVQSATVTSGGANPKSAGNSTAGNAPGVPGGQREIFIRREGGTGSVNLNINTDVTGGLSFGQNGNARSRAIITYDGPGTTTTTASAYNPGGTPPTYGVPDTFALGGINGLDLTVGGQLDRVRLKAHSELADTQLIFTFYTSSTKYVTATLNLPEGNYNGDGDPVLQTFDVLMSDFTKTGVASPLDVFQHTKAITLRLNGTTRAGADILVDWLGTARETPEPSTLLMMGGAALIGALRLRKRQSA